MRFVVPEQVVTHFHIREGDVVADFGAGNGYFIKTLSEKVGEDGKIYGLEIQRGLVEKLAEKARTEGLTNVDVIWCDLEAERGTKLDDAVLDAAIMVNTLFQIQDKKAAIVEVKRTLRTGGKFLLIDWTESFDGLGPQKNDVLTSEAVKDLILEEGLVLDRPFEAGSHHYGLAFRRN